jgi:HSP20 family protein
MTTIEGGTVAVPARRSAQSGTSVARWDPFSELEELQSRTQQLMEGLWSGAGAGNGGLWTPPVDIEETDDAWIIEAEVPGVDRKDVNVDVNGSEVVITGDIKERERKGILRRRTRRTGRFEFRVSLPGEVEADGVDASLHDGVLSVRLPKPERARPHRVEVKSS